MKTARQGDVLLIEIEGIETEKLAKIPKERGSTVLAHGEATGHRHRFTKRSTQLYAPWPDEVKEPSERIKHAQALLGSLPEIPFPADESVIGIVELPKPDALVHEEHGAIDEENGQRIAKRQLQYTPASIVVVAD